MKSHSSHRVLCLCLLAAGAFCGAAAPARAQLTAIAGLYATGVDNSNALLGSNVADAHYVVTAIPGSANSNNLGSSNTVTTLAGGWTANTSGARWITPPGTAAGGPGSGGANTNRVAGTYDYTLSFTMPTGTQFWTISITGSAAADDSATIYVNGILVSGQSIAGSGSSSAFTLNSSNSTFIGGTNTIDFRVNNTTKSSTGLIVTSLGGNVIVPEAGAILPLVGAIGTYGMVLLNRRRGRGTRRSDEPVWA